MNFLINLSGPFLKTLLEKILGKIIREKFSSHSEFYIHGLTATDGESPDSIRLNAQVSLEIPKSDIFKFLQKQGWI